MRIRCRKRIWTVGVLGLFSLSGCFSSHTFSTSSELSSNTSLLTSSISSPLPSTSLLHQIESITPLAILEEVSISTEELVENNHIHANKLYFQIINNQYS